MDSTGVLAWSKNQFFPEARRADSLLDFHLTQNNSGDFLLRQWRIADTRILVSVIPLLRKYPISNRYLFPEWNEEIFGITRGSILNSTSREGAVISLNNQAVFRFKIESNNLETARTLQLTSINMIRLLGKYGGIATGKAYMKLVDMDCGEFRLPISNMNSQQFEAFKNDVNNLNFSEFSSKKNT